MTSLQDIRDELEKAASLVTAAKRLMACGTMVDLSALEGKVRFVCDGLAALDKAAGQPLLPGLERLVNDLDRLAQAMRDQAPPSCDDPGQV